MTHALTSLTTLSAFVSPAAASPTPSPTPSPTLPGNVSMSDLRQLTWTGVGDWLVGTPLLVLVTILIGSIALWALRRVINRVVATAASKRAERLAGMLSNGRRPPSAVGAANARHVQRTQTMGALLKSITTFVVFGVTALTVMSLVGIPLTPILTSAGVGGVAIAFGAQSLVKDFLSGVFMIVEDQYGVGDVIDTGEVVGTVENVSLRVTQLRDGTGMTWYVRNGEIVRIGNKTQGWSTALVDIPIAYDQDVEKAISVIREVVSAMDDDDAYKDILLEEPTVAGVESIANGAITIRIIGKTVANGQFGVQREMRERIKVALDRAQVRSPLPVAPPYGGSAPQ